MRFVRHRASEFRIDGQRLGIAGSSSGGLIADDRHAGRRWRSPSEDTVERVSSRVQAVACFFPPTDLTNFGGSENIVDVFRQRGAVDPSFQFRDVNQKTGARTLVTDRERTSDAP